MAAEIKRRITDVMVDVVSDKLGTSDWGYAKRSRVFLECVNSAIGHSYELADKQREALGQMVRATWMQWAKKQKKPKASWLQEWHEIPEEMREVDRQIGEQLFLGTLLCVASYFGSPNND